MAKKLKLKGFCISLVLFFMFLPFALGTAVTTCGVISSAGDYTLSNNIFNTDHNASCIKVTASGVNFDCQGFIVSGASYSPAIWIEGADSANFSNCNIVAGRSADGTVYVHNSDFFSLTGSFVHNCGTFTYSSVATPQLNFVGSSSAFIEGVYFDGAQCKDYVIDIDTTSSGNHFKNILIENNYTQNPANASDGIRVRSSLNEFFNITSSDSRADGLYDISAGTNDYYNSSFTLNSGSGLVLSGSSENNYLYQVYTELNSDNGLDISTNNNDIIKCYSTYEPIYTGHCALSVSGSNNNIQESSIIEDNYCGIKLSGNNNLVNNSLVISTYYTNIDTGLIDLGGSGNTFTYNWLDIYNLTSNTGVPGKLFYSSSETNYIYNNRINVSLSKWLINSTMLTNFSIPVTSGIRIETNGTQVGGNFYANSTACYSCDCSDANTDGFCDGFFTLSTFNIDYHPYSTKYVPFECIPNSNHTEMKAIPANASVKVGEYMVFSMFPSYTKDTSAGVNCTGSDGISYVNWIYTDCDAVAHHYWIGNMSDAMYNACTGFGYYCNRTAPWQTYVNITSDQDCTSAIGGALYNYDGDYIDYTFTSIHFLPTIITANLTSEGGTDVDHNFMTCNHVAYNNATLLLSARTSSADSSAPSQQILYSCWDYNNDGDYEDAFISTGESFYTNVTCPEATIHAEPWDKNVSITHGMLEHTGTYYGYGNVKILVGNQYNTFGTKTKAVYIYDDISGSATLSRPYNLVIWNLSNSENSSNYTIEKSNGAYIGFATNATSISDPLACIRITEVSIMSNTTNKYCIYNDAGIKGTSNCDCSNAIGEHGIYDYEADPTKFLFYLDYNYSRYGFNFANNETELSGQVFFGIDYYRTTYRVYFIDVVESNGCYSTINDQNFRFNGICGDQIWDNEEYPADYGGLCGTCFDGLLSPLLNETEIDYGGLLCGNCSSTGKSGDSTWQVMHEFISQNVSAENYFYPGLFGWIPFNNSWCGASEGLVASISSSQGGLLIFLIILAIFVVIFFLFLFFFIFGFWFRILRRFYKQVREKK